MEWTERHRLGILERIWDSIYGTYVLTLGVRKPWQHQGIATQLLSQFEEEVKLRASKFVFLHVIAYNEGAIRLYQKCKYRCQALMHNFYHIRSGRQPEPHRSRYDAYLFVKWFIEEEEIHALHRNTLNCLGFQFCWPLNANYSFLTSHQFERAKRAMIEWFSDLESTWNAPCPSKSIHLSESGSLFHKLFYRHK